MSTELRGAGPAFPYDELNDDGTPHIQWSGMTLRDYFAAKVMQGFASDPEIKAGRGMIAEFAYAWADAMIAERNKP